MATLKHIGRISNTGMKCIVVFREIYDERGNVQDPNHCLVIETERLPDMEHDDLVRVVESEAAQSASQFYEIAHRSMFSDGLNMLTKLHNRGYLRKYPTNQIELTPNSSTAIKLSEVNEIIRKQKSGMSEADIRNTMVDDTDKAPRNHTSLDPTQTIDQAIPTNETVLDDTAIAKNMLAQAETFLAEAERLQSEAYEMAPALRPKRGPKTKKAVVNANSQT
jgi:hypothetical protein